MNLRITLLALTLSFAACSTSNHQRLSSREYFSQFSDLAQALRFYPALLISGTGNQTRVILRKNASMQNQEPLYVVDGMPIGNNYARANHLVNMAEVVDIRLLSHTHELTSYGVNGASGVIEIKTMKKEMASD
ncbi:MAG: TonB-dependent receptor plug domain-containing protein [Saprospiraceae bacterium]|nr:TonB-dependent receptor plug domain-containing protein [Saprospiraceae bacterium]